jgi:hypothetical protein
MTIPSTISEADYGAIEDALQASEKGRRFLRAYVERSRSLESRRMLRSISRLHRAALGAPGLNAESHRDLVSVLKSVGKHRKTATQCGDAATRSAILAESLQEVEACLIALVESIEERAFETLASGADSASISTAEEIVISGRSTRLFGELSSLFTSDLR